MTQFTMRIAMVIMVRALHTGREVWSWFLRVQELLVLAKEEEEETTHQMTEEGEKMVDLEKEGHLQQTSLLLFFCREREEVAVVVVVVVVVRSDPQEDRLQSSLTKWRRIILLQRQKVRTNSLPHFRLCQR